MTHVFDVNVRVSAFVRVTLSAASVLCSVSVLNGGDLPQRAAGFLLDCSGVPGKAKWGLFFHASGPRTEKEGDFDRNASIGVAFSSSLTGFFDKVPSEGRKSLAEASCRSVENTERKK